MRTERYGCDAVDVKWLYKNGRKKQRRYFRRQTGRRYFELKFSRTEHGNDLATLAIFDRRRKQGQSSWSNCFDVLMKKKKIIKNVDIRQQINKQKNNNYRAQNVLGQKKIGRKIGKKQTAESARKHVCLKTKLIIRSNNNSECLNVRKRFWQLYKILSNEKYILTVSRRKTACWISSVHR